MSRLALEAEQWGLTPQRLAELQNELEDHLHCLEQDNGPVTAAEERKRLAQPAARRKLAAPYLTDQVVATLNRWPTRREWLEFAALLAWFALILLSDALALRISGITWRKFAPYINPDIAFSNLEKTLMVFGWFLQGAARAGFFASFTYSLWRAWLTG